MNSTFNIVFPRQTSLKRPKGVTINRKPKKDRQYNCKKKMDQMTNIALQNTTNITKDQATRNLEWKIMVSINGTNYIQYLIFL